ncbi:MAG: DUF1802 family protein [Cyanobacteria bacterium J06643_4]
MGVNSLTVGLCVPALDIMALLQGRMIVAISQTLRNPLQFLLCPVQTPESSAQLAEHYRPSFLRGLPPTRLKPKSDVMTVQAWAQFGTCRIYHRSHDLELLSQLTVWTPGHLRELLKMQQKLFLMSLQVYRFDQPVHLPIRPVGSERVGQYIQLPTPLSNRESLGVINSTAFIERQQQLFDLSPPLHPELEALQSELVTVRESGFGGMSLDRDLRYFLGWSRFEETRLYDSDLVWVRTLAQLGRSDDGVRFAQVANQSLDKLGFRHVYDDALSGLEHRLTIQSDSSSAGLLASEEDVKTPRLDIYCDAPYRLIGACSVSYADMGSPAVIDRLIQLGHAYLDLPDFAQAVKVIFTAQPLTDSAENAAIKNGVNVMRPETLQRLTELQAQHPGSIDLIKLKPCLRSAPFGEEADVKVNQFIDDILQQLKIRASLILAVKDCLKNTGEESVGTDAVFFLYSASAEQLGLPQLTRLEVQETLIEMSSPLAGYLGRVEDPDALANRRSHRYYFLRELHIEHSSLTVETY